jgi:transcription elongation factor Elf1
MIIRHCPFCGGDASRTSYYKEDKEEHFVVCNKCNARTGAYPELYKAVEAWGIRFITRRMLM